MLAYYTLEDGLNFNDLRRVVHEGQRLADWMPLIDQCFDAYQRRHYLILIPALLAVIEEAVAERAGKIYSRELHPNKLAANLEKAATSDSMKSLQ